MFTQNEIEGNWGIQEENKRDDFIKRFKKIKELFKLGENIDYIVFGQPFITKLYRELRLNNLTETSES
ncbi:hypothetical protein [uncultured Tenacibaculum sp.]|uniref:hypothetical protein n=1 Tax=uncultured Tenacibaculum sp. TaxID=174713 RepID=UPI00261FA346|nr:hypothetical protein [uncultured Tenacibaculum sp.]